MSWSAEWDGIKNNGMCVRNYLHPEGSTKGIERISRPHSLVIWFSEQTLNLEVNLVPPASGLPADHTFQWAFSFSRNTQTGWQQKTMHLENLRRCSCGTGWVLRNGCLYYPTCVTKTSYIRQRASLLQMTLKHMSEVENKWIYFILFFFLSQNSEYQQHVL